jgi:hypothetical protein
MSEWSVSKRIAVLSGILVGALLLVTAMGITASLRLADVSDDLKAAATDTLVIVRTAEDALEAQGLELRYRFDGKPESAARAISNLEEVASMEAEIARLVSEDPASRGPIATVVAETAQYRQLFERLQDIEGERVAAVEEAEDIEARLVARIDAILSTARSAGVRHVRFGGRCEDRHPVRSRRLRALPARQRPVRIHGDGGAGLRRADAAEPPRGRPPGRDRRRGSRGA